MNAYFSRKSNAAMVRQRGKVRSDAIARVALRREKLSASEHWLRFLVLTRSDADSARKPQARGRNNNPHDDGDQTDVGSRDQRHERAVRPPPVGSHGEYLDD